MGFIDELDIDTDSKFLKIKSGESVQFHILSESPKKTIAHWVNKEKTECKGKVCDLCAEGNKPRARWNIRVYDRKTNGVKDFEFGPQVAAQIKNIAEALAENQQTVDDVDFRIKREGENLESEYFVTQLISKEPVPLNLKGDVPS